MPSRTTAAMPSAKLAQSARFAGGRAGRLSRLCHTASTGPNSRTVGTGKPPPRSRWSSVAPVASRTAAIRSSMTPAAFVYTEGDSTLVPRCAWMPEGTTSGIVARRRNTSRASPEATSTPNCAFQPAPVETRTPTRTGRTAASITARSRSTSSSESMLMERTP